MHESRQRGDHFVTTLSSMCSSPVSFHSLAAIKDNLGHDWYSFGSLAALASLHHGHLYYKLIMLALHQPHAWFPLLLSRLNSTSL